MKKVFNLYIDELGMSHPKSHKQSPYYILVGCIIDQQYQTELLNNADHIKFKYWDKTDIIFHSVEIARNLNDFEMFGRNPERKIEFIKDLFDLLRTSPITITAALIDKQKAFESRWTETTVIRRSAEKVLYNFLAFIYTKLPCRGKVIIEASSGYRDREYLTAFNNLLSPNLEKKDPDFFNVRDSLTSINFVTKQNHDIESQIADILAYGIRCMHEASLGKASYHEGSYEARLMHIVDGKLIRMAPNMGLEKKKYFDKIEPIFVTPKKINRPKEKRA